MASNTGTPVCIVCGKDEEKDLVRIKEKGKISLFNLLTEAGNVSVLETMSNTEDELLRCHKICKTGLYNSAKEASRKRKREEAAEREETKQNRRRTGDGDRKLLLYKDKCILCNEKVSSYSNNASKRDYSRPDSASWKELMVRLDKAAKERLNIDRKDKWAIEVSC